MPECLIQNKRNLHIDPEFVESLKSKICKWQEKNHFDICISIEDPDGKNLYKFTFEKSAYEKLKQDIELNLLRAKIDVEVQKWTEKIAGKFLLVFYIGFSQENLKKLLSNRLTAEKNSNDEKTKLNILPVDPKFSLSQVVLPDATKKEIADVVSLLKNMHKIYYEWGFIEIDPVPRSIVNFWGPPGTGKTMTVHAIAKEMGKKILILNYADIESKYVGDAPKNLIAAFNMAEKEDAVIFFDEADSFLGKRITNVDSGSEQAINSLRSQMLMKLEEFKGIVFFATNLHENYDRAFESRILKHIEFKLPDAEARKFIIKGKLPSKTPYSEDVRNSKGEFNEEFLMRLSGIIEGFSGREIKNCVLESLVAAIKSEEQQVTSEILLKTFTAKKEEVESLKRKEKEKKEKLSNAVKKNLDEKNYNIQKIDENGGNKNDDQ